MNERAVDELISKTDAAPDLKDENLRLKTLASDKNLWRYTEESTLYYFAHYSYWVEKIRRDMFGFEGENTAKSKLIRKHVAAVASTLQTDNVDARKQSLKVTSSVANLLHRDGKLGFQLFLQEQLGIGEIMFDEGELCKGYASFVQALRRTSDDDGIVVDNDDYETGGEFFLSWFIRLRNHIRYAAGDDRFGRSRLEQVQHELTKLGNVLDDKPEYHNIHHNIHSEEGSGKMKSIKKQVNPLIQHSYFALLGDKNSYPEKPDLKGKPYFQFIIEDSTTHFPKG